MVFLNSFEKKPGMLMLSPSWKKDISSVKPLGEMSVLGFMLSKKFIIVSQMLQSLRV